MSVILALSVASTANGVKVVVPGTNELALTSVLISVSSKASLNKASADFGSVVALIVRLPNTKYSGIITVSNSSALITNTGFVPEEVVSPCIVNSVPSHSAE